MHHMIWVLYAGVLPDTCHTKPGEAGGEGLCPVT